MRRRALVIAGVVLALAAAGTPIDAQQAPRIVRIGFLSPTTLAATTHTVEAFRQALRELGYAEGKNLVLEVRHADASVERLPELARELVGLKMDAIVTISNDPVGTGFVASLARPGGNITGLCNISPELSGKRLELLREVVPGLSRVAFLWNPESRSVVLDYKETESAARSLAASGAPVPRGLPRRGSRSRALGPDGSARGDLRRQDPEGREARRPVEQPTRFELVINLKTAKTLGLTMSRDVLRRADEVIQ